MDWLHAQKQKSRIVHIIIIINWYIRQIIIIIQYKKESSAVQKTYYLPVKSEVKDL